MNVSEAEFFRQVTLHTCCSLETEKALFHSFDYLRDFIPAEQMTLNYFDEETGETVICASATAAGGIACDIRVKLGFRERQAFLNPEMTADLVRLSGSDRLSVAEKYLEAVGKPDSSLLFLRLRIEGVLQGSLILRADGANRFTEAHLQLFGMLKDPWTIVMINNRQYQELVRLKEILADDNRYLHKELQRLAGNEIVGVEKGLKNVVTLARQVAPLNSPALLLGETGVGKEVIAAAIHESSNRREGPFIKVNCGAIPDTLIDSELFGHEKGAFTGAVSQMRGRFERADEGTIFLDEIGELPLQAQVRMLRILQEQTIERVGGSESVKVNIRIIAATHRDLKRMVSQGSFREDLYYRLNVFPIIIPPLRHRKSDIADLALYFIRKKSLELGRYSTPILAPGAEQKLMAYDWPGNVRELQHAMERAVVVCRGQTIEVEDLSLDRGPPGEPTLAQHVTLEEHERRYIHAVLQDTGGRIAGPQGAAAILGLPESSLRYRMKKLGIQRP
ncbi:MAG: sigma 54-interacting transcriptional regulator [Deltaproteobacteria bacterium]|nr:sigma 54-interacting transcriptional regulator [Deltaproteobacteria bacterium]